MPEQPHHNPQEINIRDLIIEDPAPMPISWEQEMDETFGDGVLEKVTSALKERVRTNLTDNPGGAGVRLAYLRIVDPIEAVTLQESLSPQERTSIVVALEGQVRTSLTENAPIGAGYWLADLRIVDPKEAATLRESLSPQEHTSIVNALKEGVRTYLTENDPTRAGVRLADLRIMDPKEAATLRKSLSPQEHTSIVDALKEEFRTSLTEDPAWAGDRLAYLRIMEAHDIVWKRDGLHIIDTKPTPQTDTEEPQPELLRT